MEKKQPFVMLGNIQRTFMFARRLSLVAVAGSLLFAAVMAVYSLDMVKREREKIYVLDRGRSLILALQQDLVANRPVEARDHVRMFHEFFFTLSPDAEAVKANVARAMELADKSAYNYYVDLAEAGYYRRLIGANIIQTIRIDSIVCDFELYPYHVRTYATQAIMRESKTLRRKLVTSCQLVNVPRSDANPHGFLLQDFVIEQTGGDEED